MIKMAFLPGVYKTRENYLGVLDWHENRTIFCALEKVGDMYKIVDRKDNIFGISKSLDSINSDRLLSLGFVSFMDFNQLEYLEDRDKLFRAFSEYTQSKSR